MIDNFLGIRRANTGNQATAQIVTDTVDTGRQLRCKLANFKLISMFFVLRPASFQRQGFPALYPGHFTLDRNGLRFFGSSDLSDTVTIRFIIIQDALKDGCEGLCGRFHAGSAH